MDEVLVQLLQKQTEILQQLSTKGVAQNEAPSFFNPGERPTAPEHILEMLGLKKSSGKKAVANFSTATPLHGTGGVFSVQGLDRTVVTAYVRPSGLASLLDKVPSVDESPRFPTLTGFTATTGSRPLNACEDAPTGYLKGCNLTARFGLIRFDTQTLEMDKVMLRLNRGDFKDLTLAGSVLNLGGLYPSGLNQTQILNIMTMAEMVTVGVNAERQIITDLWQGTVAAGTFPGLAVQITTGQVDADTGTACPALDSDVKSFAYNNVDGSTGLDIVEYISMVEYYLYNNAETMGLLPVDWVIVMRPQLWQELSAIWPLAYNTLKSYAVGTNSTVFIDGRAAIAERDSMRSNMTLVVNGRSYRVITDTGIFEHNNINNGNLGAGEYASSIYFVPLSIIGGIPATFLEYIDYRAAAPDTNLLAQFPGAPDYFWTDNGLFSWAVSQNRWCYQLSLKTEPRVVLRTPQLAGAINYIKYVPLQHLRESDPNSPYNFDGGVSLRTATSPSAVWLS